MIQIGKKIGQQTFSIANPVIIVGTGTIVGPFEGKSPLAQDFDHIASDLSLGQSSYELAERELMITACQTALKKAKRGEKDVDLFLAGDLLNQIISAGFTASFLGLPFLGLYGACSTAAESLSVGAMMIDGGFVGTVLAATSSHNAAAERQYRYPTEYGNQRRPYAQWTVTGSGAVVATTEGQGPRVTHITLGKIVDYGIGDPLNMGAAMAPAAADTIAQHLKDTSRSPEDYDLIVTGDLGAVGSELLRRWLLEAKSIDLKDRYNDCGLMIYDRKRHPQVRSGGSGCGCVAVVAFGHLFKEMERGRYKRILMVSTGALHSPTSVMQKQTIPCIAHAVSLEYP